MKILIAIDFGLYGKAQMEFMRSYGVAQNAKIKVLHVIEPLCWELQTGYPASIALSDNVMKERCDMAEKLVREFAAKLKDACAVADIDVEVREGNVANEILTAADDFAAELLIVGSHGRTGLERFLLGSVSQAVAAHAKCTVVISRRFEPIIGNTKSGK